MKNLITTGSDTLDLLINDYIRYCYEAYDYNFPEAIDSVNLYRGEIEKYGNSHIWDKALCWRAILQIRKYFMWKVIPSDKFIKELIVQYANFHSQEFYVTVYYDFFQNVLKRSEENEIN